MSPIILLHRLNEMYPDKEKQQKALPIAVGLAFGGSTGLPSSPVDNPMQYWAATHRLPMNEKISFLNEQVVFDYKAAIDVATNVWMGRYTTAYPTNIWQMTFVFVTNNSMFNLSQENIDFIKNENDRLNRLIILVAEFLGLKEDETDE